MKFLGALGCSAKDDPDGQCASLTREVLAMSAQINAGQNFSGKRRTQWRDVLPVACKFDGLVLCCGVLPV